MNANRTSDDARARLLATPGEPFLYADWENVVFLHFTISPELLRQHVPEPFELELWNGQAWLSLVALTMRHFRPVSRASAATFLSCLKFQRFLNFRTYASAGGESGAFFLHGWFSQPWNLPWPSARFGFPYAFAKSVYEHVPANAQICGKVSAISLSAALTYDANREAKEPQLATGNAGQVPTEFLLERYTGFFVRGTQSRVFRAWHPPWLQVSLDADVSDLSLISARFPWFAQAEFAGAHYAPGFRDVWIGRVHRLNEARQHRRVLSAFFEMP